MSELIREPSLLINDEWVPGTGTECEVENPATCEVENPATCEVENPATEQLTGISAQASMSKVDAAVEAARAAFRPWARTPVGERAACLRRLHDVIAERADRFAELVTREQGSPPTVARKLHVDVPLAVIARTADALEEFSFRSKPFGGYKQSGVGREIGDYGISDVLQVKAIQL